MLEACSMQCARHRHFTPSARDKNILVFKLLINPHNPFSTRYQTPQGTFFL